MSTTLHLEPSGGSASASLENPAWTTTARMQAAADAELVRRFNAGDENAFTEIVRRHRGRLFCVVGGCLRDRADVEEIVDDAFLRAYRGLAKFRGDSSLATWLYHIAINLARNRYWYLFRRRHLAPSLDAPISTGAIATHGDFVLSEEPTPLEALDQREYSGAVVSCLERLPPRQRDVLKLRGLLNSSYEDIAAKLGLDVVTVKSRIARARQCLRREMTIFTPRVAPIAHRLRDRRAKCRGDFRSQR